MIRAAHSIAVFVLVLAPLVSALGWQILLWLFAFGIFASIWVWVGEIAAFIDGLEAEGL